MAHYRENAGSIQSGRSDEIAGFGRDCWNCRAAGW
jgi:hypothetical protein